MAEVHQGFAWVFVVSNAVAGGWCLGAHRWPSLRTRALWWFVIASQLTVFVQAVLGVVLVQQVPAPQFHLLYGFSGIVAVGILYAYRAQLRDKQYLLYGFGGLFIMGLGIRAMLVR